MHYSGFGLACSTLAVWLLMVFLMQSVELTNEVIDFLRSIFELFDVDNVRPGL